MRIMSVMCWSPPSSLSQHPIVGIMIRLNRVFTDNVHKFGFKVSWYAGTCVTEEFKDRIWEVG